MKGGIGRGLRAAVAASLLGALFAAAPAGAVVSNVPLQAPWVTNGDVNAVAQLGGRTYLGGSFSFVGPRTGPLALLDQSKDGYAAGQASLVPGMPVANGAIYAVASDPSGGWFVGGAFTVIGGVTQPYLAHVDQGQVDQSFVPAIGGPVRALAVAPSALYVGGSFGTASGAKELNVTRVSTLTGAVDPDWEHTDTIGVNGRVNALALSGNQLYVGGHFQGAFDGTSPDVMAASNLIALNQSDGTPPQNGFAPTVGNTTTEVRALGATTSGVTAELVVGGTFQTPSTNLAVYNLTNNMTVPLPDGYPDGAVDAIAADSSGDAWIGGEFANVTTFARAALAKYELPNLDPHWNPGADGPVQALALRGNSATGTLAIGGGFTKVDDGGSTPNPHPRAHLAELPASAGASPSFDTVVSPWHPGAGNSVLALAVGPTSPVNSVVPLLAGGTFLTADGLTRQSIAALGANGAGDNGFTANTGSGSPAVWALATNGSRLYAGGSFEKINGVSSPALAQLDPATGALAGGYVPHTTGSLVEALAFSADGNTLYAGGHLSVIGLSGFPHLAAFNSATGAVAATQPPNPNDVVVRLLRSGNVVYVGGRFTTFGGASRPKLAAFFSSSGQRDTTFAPSVTTPAGDGDLAVTALALAGKHLFIGGAFDKVGGRNHPDIAAVNPTTGAVDNTWFANLSGKPVGFAVLGNHLYAAGFFGKAGVTASSARTGLAAFSLTDGGLSPGWRPELGGSAALAFGTPGCSICAGDTSAGGTAKALLVSGNTLLVGHDAATVNGVPRPGFAVFGFVAPHAIAPRPKVLGFPWPNQTLACRVGGFTGGPETYSFRWLRDGHLIAGAVSQTHRFAFGDVGHRIACRVTGTNPAGSDSETSPAVKITLRPGGPKMNISSASVRASRSGAVSIKVTCPRGFSLCAGTLFLGSAGKINGKKVSFGSGGFSLHGARSQFVRIQLSSGNQTLLKQKGSIRCTATALAHDASNRYGQSSTQLTLRAPK